jgi:hypothetical protein
MSHFLILIISLIIATSITNDKSNTVKDSFLDWGIKNNLNISPLIELSTFQEKSKIRFLAKDEIPRNTLLLTIPYSLMFNISKLLDLLNSKNLNKQYHEFSKLNITYNKTDLYDIRKECAFISYLFYLIEHKPKKYQKTKFYEIYKDYLNIIKTYNFKSPIFYDQDQVEYLAGTHLSNVYDDMKKIYQTEIDVFSNNTYYKKELDFDEYARNRLIIYNKGLNISNSWCLVPFFNFFENDYSKNNANFSVEKNGDVKIYSRKKIKKGDEIILKGKKIPNIKRLLLEGKTNEKLLDYYEEYLISAFSPGLYYSYGINEIEYFRDYFINLKDEDFDSKANNIYFEKAEMLGGDGSDNWAYGVLENNLYFYKEHFEKITLTQIYDKFYDKDDRANIERIYRSEQKVIEAAYEKVNKVLDQLEEIKEKYMKDGKNSKNAKVIDL